MSALCVLLFSMALTNPEPQPAAKSPPVSPSTRSEAEKISSMQRSLEDSEKELEHLKKELDDPQSEFARSQSEFRELDANKRKLTREIEKLRTEKKDAEADVKQKELDALKPKWERGRTRSELAIEERKTKQAKIEELPGKIEKLRKSLEKATGSGASKKEPGKKPADEPKKLSSDIEKTSAEEKKPTQKNTTDDPETPKKSETSIKESRKLKEAREQAKLKEEAALKAQDRVKSVTEYFESVKRQIELEQRLLETARKKLALARDTLADAEKEQKQREEAKAPEVELAQGRAAITDALRRVDEASNDEREITDRLADLQERFARVQSRHITALQEAEQTDRAANDAKGKVDNLENPFNPRNVLQWFLDHGGRILGILFGMTFFYLLVRSSSNRLVRLMAAGKIRTGREGENRAATLVGVFRTVLSATILCGGMLMLLDEVGIPIVPLMGGAAVLGLAVAFGAQNLIKDYFTGFMVLMEDQYAVNDIVKINGVGGKVERITLRMTVLRDNAGTAHFIPHGTIGTVSNMSHGWARCNLDISIGYKEDPDRVMEILREICNQLRSEDKYSSLILDDPEIPGVDALGDSAVMIKVLVKTQPMKQWDVKRELLRRIKLRFDEEGIEIPFPQRVIHHIHEHPDQASPRLAA